MNKPFIAFLQKSQSQVKICIGLCLALIFSICSGSINTYAETYSTSGTFYVYEPGEIDSNISEHNYSIVTNTNLDISRLCIYGIQDIVENILTDDNSSSFISNDQQYFNSFNDIFNYYEVGSYINTWCSYHSFGTVGFQLVKYNWEDSDDYYFYRFLLYFLTSTSSNDNNLIEDNGSYYFVGYPSFITLGRSSDPYIFSHGSKIGLSIQASTGSYYSVPISLRHNDAFTNGTTFSFTNTYNDQYNRSLTASINYFDKDLNDNWSGISNLDFQNSDNELIVVDIFLGDYGNNAVTVGDMSIIYRNSFPRYVEGTTGTYLSGTYTIDKIWYGSLGPINQLSSVGSSRNGNQYYLTRNNPNSIIKNAYYDFITPVSVTVTPTTSPVPSGSPEVTPQPQYTQIPYYTQAPYYTQMPYPTQEPYYTQMPYPTQEPYYTQMPYPTQRPYYTQIPYPSGLNDLGELTDKLLTPMPNPTGSELQYYDFDLDSVNINLNNDLTNSQSKNFFFAFISILWDKMNLLCFGYFALALGLIFIWYLLGHGRRG